MRFMLSQSPAQLKYLCQCSVGGGAIMVLYGTLCLAKGRMFELWGDVQHK